MTPDAPSGPPGGARRGAPSAGPTPTGEYGPEPREGGLTFGRALVLAGIVALVAFWVWALFFADKTAVNKIDDRAWAERAEAICEPVEAELRELSRQTSTDLAVRADLVVTSTDLLSRMLDDVTAVEPGDEKGRAIVPDWEADYRQLLDDRYRYAERLRAGQDGPFTETAVQGVPITERLETFAGDNEMPSCAPPRAGVL